MKRQEVLNKIQEKMNRAITNYYNCKDDPVTEHAEFERHQAYMDCWMIIKYCPERSLTEKEQTLYERLIAALNLYGENEAVIKLLIGTLDDLVESLLKDGE